MKFTTKQLFAVVPAAAFTVAAVAVVALSATGAAGVPVSEAPRSAAVEAVSPDSLVAGTTAQDWKPVAGSGTRRGFK